MNLKELTIYQINQVFLYKVKQNKTRTIDSDINMDKITRNQEIFSQYYYPELSRHEDTQKWVLTYKRQKCFIDLSRK